MKIFNNWLINYNITLKVFRLLEIYKQSQGLLIPESLISAASEVTGQELLTYELKHFNYIKD